MSGKSLEVQAVFQKILAHVEAMEENQRQKVIDLARRLVPHLTAEDIRNPHDFPDLADPDWHFEDGQLTGIQSVLFALRALSGEGLFHGEQGGDKGAGEASEHDEEDGREIGG